MFLLFAVNTLGQVSGPTESAVLPIVANDARAGERCLDDQPRLRRRDRIRDCCARAHRRRIFGVDIVFYLAGVMLLLAASRVFDLPVDEQGRAVKLPPLGLRFRPAVTWLLGHPAVATMIIFSTLAGTVNIVLQTLAPRYVVEVLRH